MCSFSGYDFGYLLKILMDRKLPKDEPGFFELLKVFFPNIYDIKVSSRKHLVSWIRSKKNNVVCCNSWGVKDDEMCRMSVCLPLLFVTYNMAPINVLNELTF
jgi:hypothetical protein